MIRPKLLLADDSVTIRKVVELTFADEGIDVSTVADADSAMQRFIEIQPDIVLVDVGLEGTSGYQICEMIKLDEATRHIPVLLLVGSFEPFDQDEAERVGADGFLTKPFHSIRDLVARVSDLLGLARQNSPVDTDGAFAAPEPIEHLQTEEFAPPVTPETADIEYLFRNSFAETAEIDELDTVDNAFGDSAFDDGMIESSYPTEAYAADLNGLIPSIEAVEETKEFDWSSESIITETPAAESVTAGFEPKFAFDDSAESTIDAVAEPAVAEALELAEEDISAPESVIETSAATDANEPSAEFIALIAQKVVEKLSDRVIREIAQEAVPRIAEKLIREALDDGGKRRDQTEI